MVRIAAVAGLQKLKLLPRHLAVDCGQSTASCVPLISIGGKSRLGLGYEVQSVDQERLGFELASHFIELSLSDMSLLNANSYIFCMISIVFFAVACNGEFASPARSFKKVTVRSLFEEN